jgi:glycine cleavage system H protein
MFLKQNAKHRFLYSTEHHWIFPCTIKNQFYIGLTSYAAECLGDILSVDLSIKKSLTRENSIFGIVDTVTHTSNLIMPIDCNILEANRLILEAPELINISPFKHGWILKFKAKNFSDTEKLLNYKEYESYISTL